MYLGIRGIHFLPITGLILGVIGTSNTTMLLYQPHRNVNFNCPSREGDQETNLTFAVNNDTYGIDKLDEFVQLSRTHHETGFIINITLNFSSEANGSVLWCCYINGSQIIRRESFQLMQSKYSRLQLLT
jgi:hypothetical protein